MILWSLSIVCLAVFCASRERNLRREEDLAARRIERIERHLRQLRRTGRSPRTDGR